MTERSTPAAFSLEHLDDSSVEMENRELASKQVRQINDTLRKVRRITRESQNMARQTIEEIPLSTPYTDHAVALKEPPTPLPEPRKGREDDSTGKFLIPEPTLASPVSEVFRKAIELFQNECAQFKNSVGKGSAVTRTWKLV